MIHRFLSMNPDWIHNFRNPTIYTNIRTQTIISTFNWIKFKRKNYLKYTKGKKETKYESFFNGIN